MYTRLRHTALIVGAAALLMLTGCGSDEGQTPNGNGNNGAPCEPATCESLGMECGDHSDGCDGSVSCGQCAGDLSCSIGQCVDDSPVVTPEVTIDEGPSGRTNETSASLEFSCDVQGCTTECSLDGEAEACSSPHTYDDLPDGERLFRVRGSDGSGNTGEWAERSWTVDTEPPVVTNLFGPADPSGLSTVSFDFDCSKEDCQFECSLDGGDPESCEPGVSYGDIEEGAHTFEVSATDDVGNEGGAATWQWTMDPEVPDVIDLEGPADPTSESSATFTFDCSRSGCDFECSLDNEDFESCDSGITYEDLDDGLRTFEVRATDAEGNQSGVVEWSWTIDTSTPEIIFSQAPDSETGASEATFEFDCSAGECVSFECALDSDDGAGSFESCTSPQTFSDLSGGSYTFRVRATNATGSVGEASYSWVIGTSGWAMVSPGGRHSCGLTNDGALYCWGDNSRGQLGDTTEIDRWTPTQVGSSQDWTHVSAGGWHTCGIRDDQSLWCWGDNGDGRLGTGSAINNSSTPMAVANQYSWDAISAGSAHNCAIRTNGSLHCWGDGSAGQIGDGAGGTSGTPSQVGSQFDWTDVTAGEGEHSCGRRANGSLWCWGSNAQGQLGDDSDEDRDIPVQVGDEFDWSAFDPGARHSCGLRGLGELWCWGDNERHQIGEDADEETNHSPLRVGLDNGWGHVAAGGNHTCALRSNSLYCWGSNDAGQLGDGSEEDSDIPVTVMGFGQWSDVAAAADTTCAIRDDQTLWCWGDNEDGQLGDGSDEDRLVPVEIAQP